MSKFTDMLKESGFIKPTELEENNFMEIFRNSSVDNPSFAKIAIFDSKTISTKHPKEIWKGLAACEGTRTVYMQYEDESYREVEQVLFRSLENSNSKLSDFAVEKNEFKVKSILKPNRELQEEYEKARDKIVMTITACVFPEYKVPVNDKSQSRYWEKVRKVCVEAMNNPLTEHTYTVHGLETIKDAEKWLLQNHPEEAISFSYSTNTGGCNFVQYLDQVSAKSYLGTREQREDYVRGKAKEYGIELPLFNYAEANKEQERRNAEKEHENLDKSRNNEIDEVKTWVPKKDEKQNVKDVNIDR